MALSILLRALALLLPVAALAAPLQVTVVDKEGKPVQDAVVQLAPPAGVAARAPLPARITINQERMRFLPPVALIGAGGRALFVNNDPWEHHVRGTAAGAHAFDTGSTGGFELRLDAKAEGKPAPQAEVGLDKAGAVLLGCHLHASMRGHVFVSDTPWAALTGADGLAAFEGLPDAGTVQVRVWHADQLLPLAPQAVTLGASPGKATVQLSVVPRRRRV